MKPCIKSSLLQLLQHYKIKINVQIMYTQDYRINTTLINVVDNIISLKLGNCYQLFSSF